MRRNRSRLLGVRHEHGANSGRMGASRFDDNGGGVRMQAGHDYIGVGVGAMIFDDEGEVFLAQRGPAARNERGCWEFPGGAVAFGERLEDAIQREIREEFGIEIVVERLLAVVDHLLPDEAQHWISPTYIARHTAGVPRIVEPEKCSAFGWFLLSALPEPLTIVTREDVRAFLLQADADR